MTNPLALIQEALWAARTLIRVRNAARLLRNAEPWEADFLADTPTRTERLQATRMADV